MHFKKLKCKVANKTQYPHNVIFCIGGKVMELVQTAEKTSGAPYSSMLIHYNMLCIYCTAQIQRCTRAGKLIASASKITTN